MNLRNWYKWYKSLHISRKWFVVLILIRPIVDNFYELKEASALASPLYIVGALTPVFVVLSFLSPGLPKKIPSIHDGPMYIWAAFVFFNCLIFWFLDLSVVAFGDLIKYCSPFILYFYSRRFVQSRIDLDGIMFTFLISAIFPFGMLLYESVVNPIAIEYISAGRGGGSRIRGAYADIMNYAIYLILFLIIAGYFFLKNIYERFQLKVKPIHLIIALLFVFYGLTRIKHVSTWTVGLVVFILFMVHNLRNAKGAVLVIALMTIVLPFFAQDIYTNQLAPLINKEIMVAEGQKDSDQAFNGRMTRWEKYIEVWEQMPAINHFIGVTLSNFPETDAMISAGMHSDYIRLLFLSGFIGLGFYILFLLMIAFKWVELRMPERFLLISTVAAVLLWSVSTIPTLYASLLYFVYPVFSFALLPWNRKYNY